jgi:hypothetical protein
MPNPTEPTRYRLASVKGYVGRLVEDRTGGIVLWRDHEKAVQRIAENERERLARKERPGLPPILMSLHDAAPELAAIIAAALTVAEEEVLKEVADCLRPFVEAKPLPGSKDDRYQVTVDGAALCEAKELLSHPFLAAPPDNQETP